MREFDLLQPVLRAFLYVGGDFVGVASDLADIDLGHGLKIAVPLIHLADFVADVLAHHARPAVALAAQLRG